MSAGNSPDAPPSAMKGSHDLPSKPSVTFALDLGRNDTPPTDLDEMPELKKIQRGPLVSKGSPAQSPQTNDDKGRFVVRKVTDSKGGKASPSLPKRPSYQHFGMGEIDRTVDIADEPDENSRMMKAVR